jgi:hypothetical protein
MMVRKIIIESGVARFFLAKKAKKVKNFQIPTKYIPNVHEIYQKGTKLP